VDAWWQECERVMVGGRGARGPREMGMARRTASSKVPSGGHAITSG
jgi:hypothetical protein